MADRYYDSNEIATDSAGNVLVGRAFSVYTAESGGTQLTSTIKDWTAGTTLSGGIVLSDSKGRVRCRESSDTYDTLWFQDPSGTRWPIEALGRGAGGGNVNDNTTETIAAVWTFTEDPVFNDGAIPQAKVVNLVSDLLAAANPGPKADTANQTAMLGLTANRGDWTYRTDTSTVWMLLRGTDPTVLANWVNLGAGSSTFTRSYANAEAGSVYYVKGLSSISRPSARTDILFIWITTDGLTPVNMSGDDVHLNALES